MSESEVNKANTAQPLLSDKKQEKTSITELKNGKVNFKQKPLSFEKQSETLQEIVTFRGMLEDRISKQAPPLVVFPEDHKPLIAKLAHESDKSLAVLAKHIHHELLPTLDEDDEENSAVITAAALPINAVEDAIKSVLTRNNYGLDAPLGVKLPAAVCVWRWEVRNEHTEWLPKNSREKAEARRAERVTAKEELKAAFDKLPQDERDAIIDPKKTTKLPTKELNRPETTPNPESKPEQEKSTPGSSRKGKKKADEAENDQQGDTPKSVKKSQDPEKAAKEKERLEKKAAKQEKEKKEKDAHNKSQSIMARFFAKPKAPAATSKMQETAVAGPSKLQSDFNKVFKPFVLQKDKVMAPQNWFIAERKRRRRESKRDPNYGIIVIDSEDDPDIEMQDPQPTEEELRAMNPQARLSNLISNLPYSTSAALPRNQRNPPGFKIHHRVSVRDLMSQLSEAEISGNDDLVREILAKLRDRDLLPAKALCFHEDARPGYFGTWTRSSKVIGPRRPFAKDTLVFDYGYDSGEEWEEEPVGEDVADDAEDEEVDADDADSDADSWLVDDDEEIVDLASLARGSSPPPMFDLSMTSASKRKADDGDHKIGKKRKVVVPLVPFAKGPILESTVGQIEYEPFRPYTIQLFNDTPMSIDPFTFVSSCIEDCRASQRNAHAGPVTNQNPTSEGVFVVPALPPRLTATTLINNIVDPTSQTLAAIPTLKKAPAQPKSVFPDIHMTYLFDKINKSQASSINALIEVIYQELREHKVTKVAIEAKIKEVGEKSKDKKIWVVKPALMAQVS